jgi:hypothetical protein
MQMRRQGEKLNPPWCLTHQAAIHRSFTGLFATICGAYLLTSSCGAHFLAAEAAVSAIGSSRPVASRCDFLNAEIAESPEHFKWKIIADYGRYRKVKPNGVLEVAFQFNPAQPHVTLSGLPLRLPRIKSIRRDKDADPIDTLVTCA